MSLEEINSLGLPPLFFLGFASTELCVQKEQEECEIFSSVFWVPGE